jgi:alginate O-acetyltransferase complex protein AlgI
LSFTDFSFLVFIAVVAALCRLCPKRWRSLLLLASSYLFYLTWNASGAVLLAAATGLTFLAALAIERARDTHTKRWLAPATVTLLAGYLLVFKIALITPSRGILGLIMPLGISYTTFKLISYVLEVHWGKMNATRSLPDFAAYVAFFPQIVAGPIQRPASYFAQLPPVPVRVADALPRIAWGFIKKLIVADNLAPAVNYVYSHLTAVNGAPLTGAPLWLGFYLYPLQIYADFSGLTDIAIGTGRLFGITGPENFNRPFTATNISDFWRRWHISLTSWLSDYVFMPLRMATRTAGDAGLAFSIAVNMIAIGLWHGLSLTFLAFGVVHAVYLIVEAFTSRKRAKFFKRHRDWDAAAAWLGCLLTFHLVAIGLVFFRASRLSDAIWLLGHLLTGLSSSGALFWAVVDSTGARVLAIGLVGYAVLELGERFRPDLWLDRIPEGPRWVRWSAWGAAAVLLIFGVALLLAHSGRPHSPFVYEIF